MSLSISLISLAMNVKLECDSELNSQIKFSFLINGFFRYSMNTTKKYVENININKFVIIIDKKDKIIDLGLFSNFCFIVKYLFVFFFKFFFFFHTVLNWSQYHAINAVEI